MQGPQSTPREALRKEMQSVVLHGAGSAHEGRHEKLEVVVLTGTVEECKSGLNKVILVTRFWRR